VVVEGLQSGGGTGALAFLPLPTPMAHRDGTGPEALQRMATVVGVVDPVSLAQPQLVVQALALALVLVLVVRVLGLSPVLVLVRALGLGLELQDPVDTGAQTGTQGAGDAQEAPKQIVGHCWQS